MAIFALFLYFQMAAHTNEEAHLKAKLSRTFEKRVKWMKFLTTTISHTTSFDDKKDLFSDDGHYGLNDGNRFGGQSNKEDLSYRDKVNEMLSKHLSTESVARIFAQASSASNHIRGENQVNSVHCTWPVWWGISAVTEKAC